MNWDITTTDEMNNAKAWTQNMIDMLNDGGSWAIPRSLAIYTFNKCEKTVTRVNSDSSVDRVLTEMGWVLK